MVAVALIALTSPAGADSAVDWRGNAFAVTPNAGDNNVAVEVHVYGACTLTDRGVDPDPHDRCVDPDFNNRDLYLVPTEDCLPVENCSNVEGIVTTQFVSANEAQGACNRLTGEDIGEVVLLDEEGQVIKDVLDAADVLAVRGIGTIPANKTPGVYIVCAGADPWTLWNYYTVRAPGTLPASNSSS